MTPSSKVDQVGRRKTLCIIHDDRHEVLSPEGRSARHSIIHQTACTTQETALLTKLVTALHPRINRTSQ
jgi:hypothetical protein